MATKKDLQNTELSNTHSNTKLTAERKQLDSDYRTLKDEVKEAEQIRRSVYSILRQEQREQQPRRTQDMEL